MSELYSKAEDCNLLASKLKKKLGDKIDFHGSTYIEIPSGKNTGAITYTIFYYCEGKKIRDVENTSFIPMPEVTSQVINLKLRKEPFVKVDNEKVFFNIIKSGFLQRRKILLNALINSGVFLNKEEGILILKQIGLNENIRAENLRIEDYANLTNLFCKKYSKKPENVV